MLTKTFRSILNLKDDRLYSIEVDQEKEERIRRYAENTKKREPIQFVDKRIKLT